MTALGFANRLFRSALVGLALADTVLAGKSLYTIGGLSSCQENPIVSVQSLDIQFDYGRKTVNFTIAGTSRETLNVTANLDLSVYGINIPATPLNPCGKDSYVPRLCPVPTGTFSAKHEQTISPDQAAQIPDVAYRVPDIGAVSRLRLFRNDGGGTPDQSNMIMVACTENQVTNGVTSGVPGLTYAAAAVAGASLLASTVSSVSLDGTPGQSSGPGPGFTDVLGWFQIMALNGMMSLDYPLVFLNFNKNFGFALGLLPWRRLQESIETFRVKTGGSLAGDSLADVNMGMDLGISRQSNDTIPSVDSKAMVTCAQLAVSGIKRYCNSHDVAPGNAFLTVLVMLLMVAAAIIVLIPLVKSLMELWARVSPDSLPKHVARYRARYWGAIGRTLATGVLVFYTPLVAFSITQLMAGDSRAVAAIAGLVLALVTGVLAFLSWKIWTAVEFAPGEGRVGNPTKLFEDKEVWLRYNFLYGWYRRDYWWLFMVVILYKLALGLMLAAADGRNTAQAVARLVIEFPLLVFLAWARPWELRSGNILNIAIQAVNVILAGLNFAFAPGRCLSPVVGNVLGMVLVGIYAFVTLAFAVLVVVNLAIQLWTINPHRKKRRDRTEPAMDNPALEGQISHEPKPLMMATVETKNADEL
ncbi:hypothetical protein B0H67DRAFT_561153 [Lasiosphaeris hirsuta]|uniref:ML-like domain-containing protein n=1 Tax=Lasiosphaeris hirsuta TaxID=260670 RepID=A0AA40BA55_9PEZI|nr:hypothetical protein B0H67DRAFT_561153 [Lasiosphaeris hirsuta]